MIILQRLLFSISNFLIKKIASIGTLMLQDIRSYYHGLYYIYIFFTLKIYRRMNIFTFLSLSLSLPLSFFIFFV